MDPVPNFRITFDHGEEKMVRKAFFGLKQKPEFDASCDQVASSCNIPYGESLLQL